MARVARPVFRVCAAWRRSRERRGARPATHLRGMTGEQGTRVWRPVPRRAASHAVWRRSRKRRFAARRAAKATLSRASLRGGAPARAGDALRGTERGRTGGAVWLRVREESMRSRASLRVWRAHADALTRIAARIRAASPGDLVPSRSVQAYFGRVGSALRWKRWAMGESSKTETFSSCGMRSA